VQPGSVRQTPWQIACRIHQQLLSRQAFCQGLGNFCQDGSATAGTVSPPGHSADFPLDLQAFEGRLLKLEGFLKDYQQRRRSRAPPTFGEPSTSGRGFMDYPQASNPAHSGMPPSKKPRLEEAAKQEDQRCGSW
jgi:hypothetical protein